MEYYQQQKESADAKQANRKKQFISENLEAAFNKLGWKYCKDLKYEFVPLIITSNSICVGHAIDEVPVCDLKIISKYFSSNIVPFVSVNVSEHIAWFEIYKDFIEAQSNIYKYLNKPPQLTMTREDFAFKSIQSPNASEVSPKIVFTRLIKKQIDINKLVCREFSFPIILAPNFREVVSKMDLIV